MLYYYYYYYYYVVVVVVVVLSKRPNVLGSTLDNDFEARV